MWHIYLAGLVLATLPVLLSYLTVHRSPHVGHAGICEMLADLCPGPGQSLACPSGCGQSVSAGSHPPAWSWDLVPGHHGDLQHMSFSLILASLLLVVTKGWWSVATSRLLHLRVLYLVSWRPLNIAVASPPMGAVIPLRWLAEGSPSQHQPPPIRTACWGYLLACTDILLQDPAYE